jgi:hypothetical protein
LGYGAGGGESAIAIFRNNELKQMLAGVVRHFQLVKLHWLRRKLPSAHYFVSEVSRMIVDKNGQPVLLDSTIDVRGTAYTIQDIDGDVIVAIAKQGGVTRRFNLAALQMRNTQQAEDNRRKFIDARIKLHDY